MPIYRRRWRTCAAPTVGLRLTAAVPGTGEGWRPLARSGSGRRNLHLFSRITLICPAQVASLSQNLLGMGEIVLGIFYSIRCPGLFEDFKGCFDRLYSLLEFCHPLFPFAPSMQCETEVLLGAGPQKRDAIARPFLEGCANAATASSSRAVPLSRSPSLPSAVPRLSLGPGPIEGTRSRVSSSRAAR